MSDVDADIGRVADWLEEHVEEVTDILEHRLRDEVPAFFEGIDPVMADAERTSVVANLRAVAQGLGHGRAIPEQLPPGAVDEALFAAREALSWSALARTYTIGHANVWEQLSAEVERWDLRDARRAELLRVVSRYLFAYIDQMTTQLADVYLAERDRVLRSQIIDWPSRECALAFYQSPEYAPNRARRLANSTGRVPVVAGEDTTTTTTQH